MPSRLTATILALTISSHSAIAEEGRHFALEKFDTAPCTEIVAAIDYVPPEDLQGESLGRVLGVMSMYWGMLLGIELLHPEIRGQNETFLMRLRSDCASTPDVTARSLVEGYITED